MHSIPVHVSIDGGSRLPSCVSLPDCKTCTRFLQTIFSSAPVK